MKLQFPTVLFAVLFASGCSHFDVASMYDGSDIRGPKHNAKVTKILNRLDNSLQSGTSRVNNFIESRPDLRSEMGAQPIAVNINYQSVDDPEIMLKVRRGPDILFKSGRFTIASTDPQLYVISSWLDASFLLIKDALESLPGEYMVEVLFSGSTDGTPITKPLTYRGQLGSTVKIDKSITTLNGAPIPRDIVIRNGDVITRNAFLAALRAKSYQSIARPLLSKSQLPTQQPYLTLKTNGRSNADRTKRYASMTLRLVRKEGV